MSEHQAGPRKALIHDVCFNFDDIKTIQDLQHMNKDFIYMTVVSVASIWIYIGDLKLKCACLKQDQCIQKGKCTEYNICVCFQAFMGDSLYIHMLTGS